MRASDGRGPGIGLHFFVRQIEAELAQSLDDLGISVLAARDVVSKREFQARIIGIDEVPQDVQFHVVVEAANLDPGDDGDAQPLSGSTRVGKAAD